MAAKRRKKRENSGLFSAKWLDNRWMIISLALWLFVVLASLAWNWIDTTRDLTALARIDARSSIRKDLLYWEWVATEGDVYAPTHKVDPVNGQLIHISHPAVVTPWGERLVLVNPAWLVRQVFELGMRRYGIWEHLTSLKPLRRQNAPDPWERRALEAFIQGAQEVSALARVEGKTYLRLMLPLHAEKSCLRCHAAKGFKMGDVLGGLSISVPFAPYSAAIGRRHLDLLIAHIVFGIIGVAGILAAFIGIRRRAMVLKEREEQLRTLINATPDIICFKDGKGRWLEANEADLELFRLKGVDYRGKTDSQLAEYTDPIYRQAFLTCEATDEKAWEVGGISRGEEVIPLSDGGERIYDVIKVPLFEADGTRKGLVVLGRDITERKQAEAESQMLLSAVEQTGDPIIITDREGTILYVNPAFERCTGYSREEVMGKNPRILKSGEHDEEFYRKMWATISSGETWHGRMVNRRKDGAFYTVDTTISPVFDDDGKIWRYVAIQRDVTEHIRLHEEKARLEAQLQQAQRLESVGRLAGGVAHDLNNLLTPIMGYAELLLEDLQEDARLRGAVEQMLEAGRRARDIVGKLLAFSRRQPMEMRSVDLNQILRGLEKLLRRTIREDIQMEWYLAPSLPPILGDIGQLEQVIMNLAVNAQDAMPDGGVMTFETQEVELDEAYAATHQGVKPGRYVMLAVSDTGHGMDAETLEHIFEPFFTTKEQDRGTGLGLATVYGIVKQHRGNIWAYSEPGKGTTFKVYLPVAQRGEAAVEKKASSVESSEERGTGTVLLVEDDRQVRELIETMLSRQGYEVLSAVNGEEALSILEGRRGGVDLLLTDVIMPGINGKELYKKAVSIAPGLKVIYMSGYTENIIAHRGILEEGTVFIQKPFAVKDLTKKVREVMGSS